MQYVLKLWHPSTISDAWQWRVYNGESHYIGTLFFNRISGSVTHNVKDVAFNKAFSDNDCVAKIEDEQEEIYCPMKTLGIICA